MTVAVDALDCNALLIGQKDGYMAMVNIKSGYKVFTSMMAYADSPVNKTVPIINLFGMDKGIFTVGDDGCMCVWSWKKPDRGSSSRGRGRGRGRGGRGKGKDSQGDQGREW